MEATSLTATELALLPAWMTIKDAATAIGGLQEHNGSIPDIRAHGEARALVEQVVEAVASLAPLFPHDADYLSAVQSDLTAWASGGFHEPDFLASITAFGPATQRIDGTRHLVVFPMYTQNGSTDRHLEALLVEVMWPDFIGELEAGDYTNKLFLPMKFIDYTPGYDTNSAVLFPETVAMREVPQFTWGAIFQDREAARFRTVTRAAVDITGLALPEDAQRLLDDQLLAQETFIMWDLIHDRTHMSGDLPFDPFMIKQRMPYFLYGLEELRCDLTAFRECVKIVRAGDASDAIREHAKLVVYAVVFDRIFRFALTGTRVRNYDALAGQLLFAWLHQHDVLHWTNNKLSIDWDDVPDVVVELGDAIDELYWRSIDRPKIAHWFAAYDLVSGTLTPHPASEWAQGAKALPTTGPARELVDHLLDDEFPLSMFYEALDKKMAPVIESTRGIRA